MSQWRADFGPFNGFERGAPNVIILPSGKSAASMVDIVGNVCGLHAQLRIGRLTYHQIT